MSQQAITIGAADAHGGMTPFDAWTAAVSNFNDLYGVRSVSIGGTGIATTTAYGILAGGTTSTGAFQNLGTGILGQQLISNGVGSLASWGYAATTQNAVINQGTILNIFGDSYSQSTQASPSTAGFVPMIANQLGATLNNQSVSGQGFFTAAKNALANISINNQNPSIVTCGFNDARRNGSAATTVLKVKAGLRSILANSFLATAVAANDAAVTTGGTWTTTSGIGDKASGNLAGLVRKSSASGNTLTWTFTGSTMVIGSFNTDQSGVVSGDWTYAIDGGSAVTFSGKNGTDGVSDGTNSNSVIPNCVVVTGLGSGSHTVVVTASETNPATIDYFGTLRPIIQCAPVIVNSLPYMTTAGYAISPSNGSTIAFQAITTALFAVCAEFTTNGNNFPVYTNEVNDIFDTATGVGADGIHPNNLGYQQMDRSMIKAIKPGFLTSSNPLILKDGSGNGSFLNNNADVTWLSVNQNQATGIFTNTGKAGANIALSGGVSDSSITFYTTATNNVSATQAMKIFKTHDVVMAGGLGVQGGFTGTGQGVMLQLGVSGGTTGLIAAVNNTSSTFIPLQVQGSTILVQSGSFFSFNTNALGNTQIGSNGTAGAKLDVLQNNLASAHLPAFKVTPGTHTAIAANTTYRGLDIVGVTQTWGSGTIAIQPFTHFRSNTLAGTSGTNTATIAATIQVDPTIVGTNGAITNNATIYHTGKEIFDATLTTTGTTGNQTINKPAGTVNIAAAGTTVTVTDSMCTANSLPIAWLMTSDTTAKSCSVVPGAGSFVITLNAASTAEVKIGFIIFN